MENTQLWKSYQNFMAPTSKVLRTGEWKDEWMHSSIRGHSQQAIRPVTSSTFSSEMSVLQGTGHIAVSP